MNKNLLAIIFMALTHASCQNQTEPLPSTQISPSPLRTQPPLPSPSPSLSPEPQSSPTSSSNPNSNQPDTKPSPESIALSLSENTLIQRFQDDRTFLNQIQNVAINETGEGMIVWFKYDSYQLQASRIHNFRLENGFRNLSNNHQVYFEHFEHHLGPNGKELMVWNANYLTVVGWQTPAMLQYLSFREQIPQTFVTQGYFNLHDITLDADGKGWLLVSNERTTGGAQHRQEDIDRGSHLFLIPVVDWQIQPQKLDQIVWKNVYEQEDTLQKVLKLPVITQGSGIIKGATLESNGNGIAVFSNPTKTEVSWQKVENFKATGTPQALNMIPAQVSPKSFRIELKQGQGYLAWNSSLENKHRLHVMPILNGQPQITSEQTIELNVLDYSINSSGTGMLAWQETDTQGQPNIKLQKLENFKLTDKPFVMTWPAGTEFSSAKIGINSQGKGYLSFISCQSNGQPCTSNSERQLWARKIDNFKP